MIPPNRTGSGLRWGLLLAASCVAGCGREPARPVPPGTLPSPFQPRWSDDYRPEPESAAGPPRPWPSRITDAQRGLIAGFDRAWVARLDPGAGSGGFHGHAVTAWRELGRAELPALRAALAEVVAKGGKEFFPEDYHELGFRLQGPDGALDVFVDRDYGQMFFFSPDALVAISVEKSGAAYRRLKGFVRAVP